MTSEGKFLFVMDPGNFDDVPAKGVAYKATRNGFEKLWETSGWYGWPDEVFLSSDGKTLVRIRREVIGFEESKLGDEFVLFFYRRGKLKAKYRVADLVENVAQGTQRNPWGWGGTFWMKEAEISPSEWHRIETKVEGKSGSVRHPDVFHLSTLEGVQKIYDLRTGELLGEKQPEPKKPGLETPPKIDPFATEEAEPDVKD